MFDRIYVQRCQPNKRPHFARLLTYCRFLNKNPANLLEKVSIHLQETRSIFELKKTQQCKTADKNVDHHICEALDCCFKVYYDEVDYKVFVN